MKRTYLLGLLMMAVFIGGCQTTLCYEGTFYTVDDPDRGTWSFEVDENGGDVAGEGELEVDAEIIALILGGEYEPGENLEVSLDGDDGGEGYISFGPVQGENQIEGDAVYTTADGTLFNGGARGAHCEDN